MEQGMIRIPTTSESLTQTKSSLTKDDRLKILKYSREVETDVNKMTKSKARVGSGSGAREKGDGINDGFLSEIKSTPRTGRFTLSPKVLSKIERQAAGAGRYPAFIVEFPSDAEALRSRYWAVLPLRLVKQLLAESQLSDDLLEELSMPEGEKA
jgi:hypothetical protein